MTQQKIKWKTVDSHVTEVYIQGENNSDPIGYVKTNFNFKWNIHPYFVILAEDKHYLNNKYNDSIEAGRILAKLWNMMGEINIRDTEEYFMNFDDIFGPLD